MAIFIVTVAYIEIMKEEFYYYIELFFTHQTKEMKQLIEREKWNVEQSEIKHIDNINRDNSIERQNEEVDKKIKEIERNLNNE